MSKISFPVTKADLKIEWFSGTGKGGQHRNKHQNCCRITHVPSGINALSQEHRERTANQRKAFRRLAKRLVAAHMAEETRERYGNTEVIRTYNQPDQRVKDHASGFTQSFGLVVGKPHIDEMIDARRAALSKFLSN